MGAYIARNTAFPRAEWQRDPSPREDPFPILGTSRAAAPASRQHPMIRKRFPLVLMLEPLHACNLTCTGCGRIREYETTITERLELDQCLAAIDECGAPVVSVCGGEPLMYKPIGELVEGALRRKKHIYLCTNGMFLGARLHEFRPHKRFFFNIHLDGLRETHDLAVERDGVFDEAIEGIRAAKAAGHMVCTNTTVYRETDMNEVEALFEYLEQFGVDGHMLSPAYGYSAVNSREIFLTREEIQDKFRDADRLFRRFRMSNTPAYAKFLKGRAGHALHGMGQPDIQHPRLEGSVLPHHGRALGELRGPDERDSLGPVRPRQRRALRALHGPLRLRTLRGPRDQRTARRQLAHDPLGAVLRRAWQRAGDAVLSFQRSASPSVTR